MAEHKCSVLRSGVCATPLSGAVARRATGATTLRMSCITRQNRLGSRQSRPELLQEVPRNHSMHKEVALFAGGSTSQIARARQRDSSEPHTAPTRFLVAAGAAHSAQRGSPEQQQASVQQQPPPPHRAAALGSRSPERSAAANALGETSASLASLAAMSLLANAATDERGMSTSQDSGELPIVGQLQRAPCSRGLAAASAAAFASASRAKTTRAPAVTAPPLSSPTASARICGCACQPWRTLWTSAPSS